MPFSVLLVDDHRIMRDGIRAILQRGSDFVIIGEADTATEAVRLAQECNPQLVLMDIGLPDQNGIDVIAEIASHCPKSKILILSIYDDEQSVVSAIRAGASGFVVKAASATDLVHAMRTVVMGGSYLSAQVSDKLLSRIQSGSLSSAPIHSGLDVLSSRERQVLRLVAEGKTSKEIAILLNLGLQTVRSYRKTMMRKLGVNNVAGLTQFALASGVTHFSVPADER